MNECLGSWAVARGRGAAHRSIGAAGIDPRKARAQQFAENSATGRKAICVWAGVANGKWHIDSHYPTQAKVRLEWGTQHLSSVWQKLWCARRTQTRTRQVLTQTLEPRSLLGLYGPTKVVPSRKLARSVDLRLLSDTDCKMSPAGTAELSPGRSPGLVCAIEKSRRDD